MGIFTVEPFLAFLDIFYKIFFNLIFIIYF